MPADGTIDPRFELVDELGRGGMGIVYRARDRERGGEVALKALREVGAADLLRLKHEFRVMCNVRHPNLVRLGELVERGGRWFFTMELVDGIDFLDWVGAPEPANAAPTEDPDSSPATTVEPAAGARAAAKRSRGDDVTRTMGEPTGHLARALPPPAHLRPPPAFDDQRLRTALRGVADGLAGLHRAGLVHRDVKPSNIKIDGNGRVVLLDFGVTIAHRDVDGEIAGTYAYMAPEQANGHATPATDWYAVGVMLFRAMTGYLPFPPTRDGLTMRARVPAPSPEKFVRDLPGDLVTLCRQLLATQPRARAGEGDVRAVAGLLLPLCAPAPVIAPFIGRREERARLVAVRERQRRDQSCHVALIIGSSGVGKTALARHFLDEHVGSRPDTLVLESRCDERETVPFNALDGIVDSLARLLTRHPERLPERALDAMSGPDAAELRRLFPVLAELARASTRRFQQSLDDSRAAAARALRELLDAIGRAMPLVLLIDDAQWADADSGGLLADLIAAPPPPLLLVVTSRVPDPSLLAGVSAPIEAITLGGLDVKDAVELANAVAGNGPVDATAIAREAEGHPMFIAELTRFAAERRATAGSLDDALWARACDLPPAARRLLHVVVTDGGALSRAAAIEACGLTPEEAADAVAELRAARLIRAGDDVVEPYHDRVREALVGRLPRSERAALHLALARTLAARDAPPERLAHHWAGCGETERAAQCAETAATRAANALAFERAAEWLAMTLELGRHEGARRRALLIMHAEALTHAGHAREAGHAYLEAARTGDPDLREQRELRRHAAERLLAGGYSVEGLAVARELLAEVGLGWPATRGAAIRALAWNHIRIGASRLRWRPRAEAELTADEKLRFDVCWSSAIGLSMVDSVRGSAFALRALVLALPAGEPRRIANGLAGAAFAAASMNQNRRLRRLAKAIARAAEQTDAPEAHCYVALADAARAYFFDNDWPGTRDIALRGLELWSNAGRGHTWEVDLFDQFVGWAHSTAADLRLTVDHADRVLRGARRRGDRFIEVGFRVQFPHHYLLADRPADAALDVEDAIGSWQLPDAVEPISNQFYWAWRARAMIALYAGRAEADAAVLHEGWRRIVASLLWKVPAVRLDVAIWAGAVALARATEAKPGNPAKMREHIAEARRHLKVVVASPLPVRVCTPPTIRAVIAHLEGDDATAIESLRKAIAEFDRYHIIGTGHAARWQLGRLLGGDEGAALIEQSRAWMGSVHAVRPERIVTWGVPGIGD